MGLLEGYYVERVFFYYRFLLFSGKIGSYVSLVEKLNNLHGFE